MIARILSGGQTGVDVAALRAAKARGISTGGTMPRGWKTQTGPRPEYAALYGMTEHPSTSYVPRTRLNVADADITVRIAVHFESAGERCTLRAIQETGRPHVDIPVMDWGRIKLKDGKATHYSCAEADIFAAVEAIAVVARRLGREVVVNVAGNSERTAPGIEGIAEGVVKMMIDAGTGLEPGLADLPVPPAEVR